MLPACFEFVVYKRIDNWIILSFPVSGNVGIRALSFGYLKQKSNRTNI